MGREARLRACPCCGTSPPLAPDKARGKTPPFPSHSPFHLGSVWGGPDSTKRRENTRLFVIFPTFRLRMGGFVGKTALFIDIPPRWSDFGGRSPKTAPARCDSGRLAVGAAPTRSNRTDSAPTRPRLGDPRRDRAQNSRFQREVEFPPSIFRGGATMVGRSGSRACAGGSHRAAGHASAASRIASPMRSRANPGG